MTQSKPLILTVDDEPHVLQLMKRILEPAGYAVIEAGEGNQVLALVSEKNPELVLLDIRMPGKTGTEVLQEITTRHPDTAVIIATGVGDAKTAIEAMKAGAFDYLMKPFDPDQVVACVQKALEKRRLLLENRAYQATIARQLNALNNLFQSHLKLRSEVEERYSRLADHIAKLVVELDDLHKESENFKTWMQTPPAERTWENTAEPNP